jgi:5S rRNA maturation endonuclease (ribonuclease M5)
MDIFEAIRGQVNLKTYVENRCGSKVNVKSVGDGKYRGDPCPFCGHHDCFTIYDGTNTYSCFSCRAGGDVVLFEKEWSKCESNMSAAVVVAGEWGVTGYDGRKAEGGGRKAEGGGRKAEGGGGKLVSLEEYRGGGATVGSRNSELGTGNSEVGSRKAEGGSRNSEVGSRKAEDADERQKSLFGLRRRIAERYHEILMKDPKGLSYQLETRMHSADVLKKFMVGLSDGKLVAWARESGVPVEDLVDVGMAYGRGKGFVDTAFPGVYVYPQFDEQGNCVYFSLKDPLKKMKAQPKKKFAFGWRGYNQKALLGKEVVIVEGEDDLLTVYDLGGHEDVVATKGNFAVNEILAHIREHAKGRTYYLSFDYDEPSEQQRQAKQKPAGDGYRARFTKEIMQAGGIVKIIWLPREDGKKIDIDDYLRNERRAGNDAKFAFEALKNSASSPPGNDDPPCGCDGDEYEFQSFRPIGELESTNIVFWSKCNQRLYEIRRADLNLDALVQIGGEEVDQRVCRTSSSWAPGKLLFSVVKRRMIMQASKNQLWQMQKYGQGIHRTKSDALLVVNGGSAWQWDGKSFSVQDEPVVGKKIIDWMPGREWIDFEKVQRLVQDMDGGKAEAIRDRLIDVVNQWGFAGNHDVLVLSGWFLAQFVQSLWPWRPNVWMSGKASSGKTLMNQLIERIGGGLSCRCEGETLTEPGLRQSIASDSCLVSIDEFEESPERKKILKALRSSGRGGVSRKGTSSQKAQIFQFSHMVFVSSIEKGIQRAAENSRFLIVETRKDPGRKPVLPSIKEARELREQMVAYALWGVFRAVDLMEGVKAVDGHDFRFVESLAVPYSMLSVCEDEGDAEAGMELMIKSHLDELDRKDEHGMLDDETRLLQDIVMSQIKVAEEVVEEYGTKSKIVSTIRTVGQLIAMDKMSDELHSTLQAHGIKRLEGAEAGIFVHPETVSVQLLKGSNWHGLNIRDILIRVDKSESARMRIAGMSLRGIVIPWEALVFE